MKFATQLKNDGKSSEYIIMANREIELMEDFTIKLYLDNPVQIDQLSDFKVPLLAYLRNSLSNSLIMIETSVMEKIVDRKPYSQTEKLAYLTEKYPLVAEIKKRLGLDMDY